MIRSSYLLTHVYGIPIRAHITLLLALPIFALQFVSVIGFSFFWGLLVALGLFASIALHELGHSVVAISKGARVRQILLLPIGGIAQVDGMSSNPSDEMRIALAGPAVSALLSLACWFASKLVAYTGLVSLTGMLIVLAALNLALVLFNMLPSFPMDGGRVFRAWMTPKVGRLAATRIAAGIGKAMCFVFGIWAIFFSFNPFLLLIAIFIYMAAGAEYRMVQMQESFMRRPTGHWGTAFSPEEKPGVDIEVGPPPYRKNWKSVMGQSRRAEQNVFEELWKKWQ